MFVSSTCFLGRFFGIFRPAVFFQRFCWLPGLEASRTEDLLILSSDPLEEDLDVVGEVKVSLWPGRKNCLLMSFFLRFTAVFLMVNGECYFILGGKL